jgi:chromosome partitioning protein
MIITVLNQKGGVGKTTSALNIGAFLAKKGKKTILIDLDPQSNLTSGLGLSISQEGKNTPPSIYDILLENKTMNEVFVSTDIENLYLVPSNISLAGAEIELVNKLSREQKLKSAISKFSENYDYIIIDNPPSLGILTINSLVASKYVIVPLQCEYYALEGVSQLLKTIDLVRDSINPDLELMGVLLTMFDSRVKISESVASEIKSFFKDKTFDTIIPRNVKLSEAPSFGKAIFDYDPTSSGSHAYDLFTDELLKKYG